ncbi:TetR/AcrR family transcriptional regulator [Dactylosporangium roseum]|uniref:TetR/AcrR family transcriptional regulator n=1 Tax=Dactylosporangium roseum TaxID=47989 RepID=A0ABY5YZF7_9ACTN|nr:TetR/AcrR family transcriptional regulator [Dactylosporangium roseum]UWZ35140.1 TetR/AcrR family transcriptional regulator [Dactylosporangium roseum]
MPVAGPPGGDPLPTDNAERSRIIEAAYRCLADSNGGGVSVNGILTAAGLSTRAFYRHFDSKDGLLLAMFRRDSGLVHDELTAVAATAPDAREALRRWIEGYLGLTAEPYRCRILTLASDELLRTSGYAAERARAAHHHRTAIAELLARGRRDGTLPLADPEPDARTILAALSGWFQSLMLGTSETTAESATAELTAFVFRALGARP